MKGTPSIQSILQVVRLAGLIAVIAVALAPLGGCVSGAREQYFESRGMVITAQAGDGSAILSQAPGSASVAAAEALSINRDTAH